MSSNKGGVAFAVIVLMVVSAAFAYVLTTPTGGGLQPSSAPTKYTQYVNLGADAAGWEYNYNTSQRNPVLNVQVSTLVYFNVTEMDGAPHNLYIAYNGAYSAAEFAKLVAAQASNPKSIEGSTNYEILSVSQITQTVGHSTQGQYPFQKAGIYTYWCSIHFETMVGLLIVNATTSTSSVVTGVMPASVSLSSGHSVAVTYSTHGFNGVLALKGTDTVE